MANSTKGNEGNKGGESRDHFVDITEMVGIGSGAIFNPPSSICRAEI